MKQAEFSPDLEAKAEAHLLQVGVAITHSRQVARLARQLFEEAAERLALPGEAVHLLVAAAYLHDVGLVLGRKSHHKASRDFVLKVAWPGLSERTRRLLANLVRYHRKALPSDSHSLFKKLSAADKQLVRKLAALLRVADGLDRAHDSAVEKVRLKPYRGKYHLVIEGKGPLEYDQAGAQRKVDLLQQELKAPVQVEIL